MPRHKDTNDDPSLIAVLALDCADYRLLQSWGCSNLLLDRHGSLETFTWSLDTPHTTEIWPTVATGTYPDVHGIVFEELEVEWDNPTLQQGQALAKRILPQSVRTFLGRIVEKGGAEHIVDDRQTECWHPFDSLYQWPGVARWEHFHEARAAYQDLSKGNVTERDLQRRLFANFRDEVAWLAEQNRGLVGTHAHLLDTAGHTYAARESKLRQYYKRVDYLIGLLLNHVDNLVILSDHGIQVKWHSDDEVGSHSIHSYVAVRGPAFDDYPLPETMVDVSDWLADCMGIPLRERNRPATVDTPEETLKALGYK